MTDKTEWQGRVGSSWAAQWQRTDRSFAPLTKRLLDAIIAQGDHRNIVDIGCGAGELSIAVASAMPDATVLGLDISADLIDVAAARGADTANLRFSVKDAAAWRDANFAPDLYVSRHGVMFFDDPVAAFSNLANAAAPNVKMIFSCFRSPAENDWARKIGALLPSTSAGSPHAPGPFAFADPDYVRDILLQAGWNNIAFEPVDFDYTAGEGNDPVGDAMDFFAQIGPAARAIRTLSGDARTEFLSRLHALAEAHLTEQAVRFAAAAWIVTAKKSA
ncbi:MAG: class I SAM-dependent methyltransferase [Sphingorhabdus sp.]